MPPPDLQGPRHLLEMVAVLHRRGYEQLRIVPFLAPAGNAWRCLLAPARAVLTTHGARDAWYLDDNGPLYSSAQGSYYFGREESRNASPERLADLFVATHPRHADDALGPDPLYMRWFADMLEATQDGALPCAFSDVGDEPELARAGWLATDGPPPRRRVPLPPPGQAEPPSLAGPHAPLGERLRPADVGRTVVLLDAVLDAEVLATVTGVLDPAEEGGGPRFTLVLHDGAEELTTVVAGPSGVAFVPEGARGPARAWLLRDADHPADRLFAEMPWVVGEYPVGTEPVWARLRGTAFFPGGSGLWRPEPGGALPPMPRGLVMVVGQDYYTKDGYLELRARGDEVHTQTWRGLRRVLGDADFLEHGCFYTNAWMGLRSGGKVTGRYAGAADEAFTARCARFLGRQIAVQRPRLVVTLGAEVPALLARLAPDLQAAWGPAPTLGAMDAAGSALVRDVSFPGTAGVTAHVVALVHPSLRNANVGRRHFTDWSGAVRGGHDAEVALLQAGLEALGVDRW